MGAVDELNHFSGQMLPVGEAKILGDLDLEGEHVFVRDQRS